jgi:hypothetical protein
LYNAAVSKVDAELMTSSAPVVSINSSTLSAT